MLWAEITSQCSLVTMLYECCDPGADGAGHPWGQTGRFRHGTVSLARAEYGQVALGVVYHPYTEECFTA